MVSIDAIDFNNIIKEAIAKNPNTVVDLNALLHNSFKQSIFILFYLSDSYALKQVV